LPQREAHSPAISCPGARLAHTAGGIFRDVLVKPVRRSTRRCRFGTAGRPRMTPCSAPHEAANERLLVLGMVYAAEAHGRTRPGAGRSRRAHHVSVQSATFQFEPPALHRPPMVRTRGEKWPSDNVRGYSQHPARWTGAVDRGRTEGRAAGGPLARRTGRRLLVEVGEKRPRQSRVGSDRPRT